VNAPPRSDRSPAGAAPLALDDPPPAVAAREAVTAATTPAALAAGNTRQDPIGETGEARAAYEQACEIEVADGEDAEETDAAELLVGLDGG